MCVPGMISCGPFMVNAWMCRFKSLWLRFVSFVHHYDVAANSCFINMCWNCILYCLCIIAVDPLRVNIMWAVPTISCLTLICWCYLMAVYQLYVFWVFLHFTVAIISGSYVWARITLPICWNKLETCVYALLYQQQPG